MSGPLFHIEIVTPVKRIYAGEVGAVTLPGVEGEMCILAHHAPMLAMLQPGIMSYEDERGRHVWAVDRGFVQLSEKQVVIVLSQAWRQEDLPEELTPPPAGSLADSRESLLYRAQMQLKGA